MAFSTQITDAAFVHLRAIHMLNMISCIKATITDAAFVHLHGIHTLDMCYFSPAIVTNAAITHLGGIQEFYVGRVLGKENMKILADHAVTK